MHLPERETERPDAARKVVPPVDADRAGGMRHRRDLCEHLSSNGLARDEEVDRLDPGRLRRLDEIFALGDEEPFAVALRARGEAPHEPQPRVRGRRDQDGTGCDSAAFACSAIRPNAAGSETARSARILRSSSISAFFRPEMNWL